ncbi:hypothetical protein B0H67DRAFT_666917 [Lasiosphaeris hirsuta]|uniref:Uncharacterized protein n=1 Tax=Lasiosphaeris hirsuta TaxID=260670 RepID=A0AA40DX28_9PEZI|nr:hypothetical protein B0H67DRAFT_666917 [Lasiosphaeris hirsuta]
MVTVFTHALVVITAGEASDSTLGIFWERERVMTARLPFDNNRSEPAKVVVIRDFLESCECARVFGPAACQDGAGYLQEHLLARRVIHFQRHCIFWECRSLRLANGLSDPMRTLREELRYARLGEFHLCEQLAAKLAHSHAGEVGLHD